PPLATNRSTKCLTPNTDAPPRFPRGRNLPFFSLPDFVDHAAAGAAAAGVAAIVRRADQLAPVAGNEIGTGLRAVAACERVEDGLGAVRCKFEDGAATIAAAIRGVAAVQG